MKQRFTFNRAGGLEGVDFHALGFRCGLEIHHQIKTDKKLFCRCPAGKYSDEYQSEVLRHMRPTLSELGEYDGTALMEFKTKKDIIYRLNKESVCTYEMDDTPPFPINREALDIALEIALLLNCKIVGEIHIIRKQYLDGSIPTGFQRTTIVGVDGWIPYKDRKIRIVQLALEEDACREVSDVGHRITFLTDRLSMPLIEVVTAPDMRDPLEAAEVGGVLGALLRLTGKVRRGAGSARQDVNVSVEGGDRVEIKGVPRLSYIPRLTGFEALRQKHLLELRDETARRGIKTEADVRYEVKDITAEAEEIESPVLKENFGPNSKVKGVMLKNLKGVFAFKLNPGWNFASEAAARVRVIACLDRMPNIAHTDPDDAMSLSDRDREKVLGLFEAGSKDVIALSWGLPQDVDTAMNEIIIRCQEILKGVINETRQYRPFGVSDFERILPGPDRMYPDTDSPPTSVTDEMIEKVSAGLPQTPWVKTERFTNLGVPEETAWNLVHSKYLEPFEKAAERYPQSAKTMARLTVQDIPHIARLNSSGFSAEEIEQFLELVGKKKLSKEVGIELLKMGSEDGNWEEAFSSLESAGASDEEIDQAAQDVIDSLNGDIGSVDKIIGIVKNRMDKPLSGLRIKSRIERMLARTG